MSKKPVPSKKQAVSSTRSRHSAYVAAKRKQLLNNLVLDTCPETGEVKRRHFVSPSGKYRGRQIFEPKAGNLSFEGIQEIDA